jgi:hypothetical protein
MTKGVAKKKEARYLATQNHQVFNGKKSQKEEKPEKTDINNNEKQIFCTCLS